jgi:magnesium chelatase family protein
MLDASAAETLVHGAEHHHLSGRAVRRVVRVALTLADLDGRPRITRDDITGALAFRPPPALS